VAAAEEASPGVEDLVQWRVDGAVGRLTLNDPDAGNALTADMRDRVGDLLYEASADLAVRAVIITGTGKAFCTGANLRGGRRPMAKPAGAPDRVIGDAARMIQRGWQRVVGNILDCEKPVIAAVNGTVAGGGVQLALACDLVVAADTARFIEVFVRRGLVPDAGAAYLLARLIGPQKAKEMCFFGDAVSAADAERMGLVNRVVSLDELDSTAVALAERLAAGPTKAIGFAKHLINRSLECDRPTAFAEEAYLQDLNNLGEDAKEGMVAFMERRDPEFHGW
jgi:2-(1,2-epoxy-1,2-dihydrophenyl)acetyl-CoA isomerase